MKKNQLVLAIGGGVSAVLVLGCAALAAVGFSGKGEARKSREKAFSELSRLYQAAPFPSEENVAAAGENLENALGWIEELDGALTVGTNDWAKGINLRRASPGEFSSLREETIQSLYDEAPVAEDGSKIVPDAFAFGFDRYSGGEPAQTPHVVRLLRQLRLTEQLVRMLYAAGPQRVEAVGRIVFETGAAAAPDDSGYVRPKKRQRDTGSRDSALVVVPAPPSDGPVPSDVERFGFRFVAREKAVLDFVNAIDAMRPFACVSGLSMSKVSDDVVFPDEAQEKESARRRGREEETFEDRAREPAQPLGPPKPPPRASRMVSGPLREAPVSVTVFVDVRFVGSEGPGSDRSQEEE